VPPPTAIVGGSNQDDIYPPSLPPSLPPHLPLPPPAPPALPLPSPPPSPLLLVVEVHCIILLQQPTVLPQQMRHSNPEKPRRVLVHLQWREGGREGGKG